MIASGSHGRKISHILTHKGLLNGYLCLKMIRVRSAKIRRFCVGMRGFDFFYNFCLKFAVFLCNFAAIYS